MIFITLPDERFRALLEAKKFLLDLTDPKKTPKVPKAIRKHAYAADAAAYAVAAADDAKTINEQLQVMKKYAESNNENV